jgi:hypothetical protein
MCNYHRRPYIDVSYQVFFIWPSGFSQEDFLGINQPETKITYGSHASKRIGTK